MNFRSKSMMQSRPETSPCGSHTGATLAHSAGLLDDMSHTAPAGGATGAGDRRSEPVLVLY